jgi:hypothetical protein
MAKLARRWIAKLGERWMAKWLERWMAKFIERWMAKLSERLLANLECAYNFRFPLKSAGIFSKSKRPIGAARGRRTIAHKKW